MTNLLCWKPLGSMVSHLQQVIRSRPRLILPPDLLKLMAITHFWDLNFMMNLVYHPKPLEGEEPDRSAKQMQKDWCKTLDKVLKDQAHSVKRSVRLTVSSLDDDAWHLMDVSWREVSLTVCCELAVQLTAVAALRRLQRGRWSYGKAASKVFRELMMFCPV